MNQLKTTPIAVYAGVAAVVIGIIAFALHWSFWDFWGGPMPGIQILLFPGNLTLLYIWHPLFTEEVNFWPKLTMLLLGQFLVVTCVAALFVSVFKEMLSVKAP